MTAPYAIRVTARAAAEILKLGAWWKLNRLSAPGAVEVELERAFALLSILPNVGTLAKNSKLAGVRRIHLGTIHHYLYYRFTGNRIDVLALWHTSRRGLPRV